MAGDERDAASDVIAAGREPPLRPQRGRLIRLLVIVLTVALAGAVAVALHYRAQASRHRAGAATLTGHAWAGAIADEYWLALDPSPVSPRPGLRGMFARGRAAPFPAGQAPCAPSP